MARQLLLSDSLHAPVFICQLSAITVHIEIIFSNDMIWIHSVCSNISAQYLGSNHHRIFFRVCLKWQNSLSCRP